MLCFLLSSSYFHAHVDHSVEELRLSVPSLSPHQPHGIDSESQSQDDQEEDIFSQEMPPVAGVMEKEDQGKSLITSQSSHPSK